MIKKLLLLLLFCNSGFSQVVINELDPDTPSTDVLEFIELKSVTSNFLLDGYVLVFYNAGGAPYAGTGSYYALDLDGYSTDVNGIIHFGNPQVSPTPTFILPITTIQNGPDVAALYLGDATDFPINTTAHASGLIDALAYSNATTTKPTALMTILGLTTCINENLNSLPATQSIQRKNDGTYELKVPTPGMNNDGSGIVLNYLRLTTNVSTITEGQSLTVTFSTTNAVTGSDLVINFSLNNGAFTTADYSGTTSITIPIGQTVGSTVIPILNDRINDGDEEIKIVVGALRTGYSLYNNNIIIRVNDINFVTLPFGSPANPTRGLVASTAPVGYYSSIEGLSGAALKQGLQDIIANPSVIHAHVYGDIYDILKVADQNPENSNQVWLIYNEAPRSKIDNQTGNSIVGKWNREHIYCQSRGGFADATSNTPQGINVWNTSGMPGPNNISTGHADAHHIRAVDGQENSSRNNRNYGVDYNGPIGNPGTWKGDVARSLFYMAVRYNGLNIINGNPIDTILGQIGDLSSLLQWNRNDTSDDFEMNRNNYIYTWQLNRNPFIDYPDLADYIWGPKVGLPWSVTLSRPDFNELQIAMYPNPTKDFITISGLTHEAKIEISSMAGLNVYKGSYKNNDKLNLNLASGIYMVKIIEDTKWVIKKLIIK
ncbi:endonuclease [Flavobacterium psychrophilum]|uniref:endonuclease n=1 Tax=Flavobacterium psychrophilum TaxID=96345 RepID=UPI001D070BA1|nr:endonuclease [Flavobacterium psychrophilum]MCB6061754.1 endonuclease [Flavobacterium psychrophilum]